MVLEHPQALADVECASAVFGVLDADLGQAVVRRPLQAVGGVFHLRLDDVEQSLDVEALGLLRHAFGGQRPAGTRDDGILIGGPGKPQFFAVVTLTRCRGRGGILRCRWWAGWSCTGVCRRIGSGPRGLGPAGGSAA